MALGARGCWLACGLALLLGASGVGATPDADAAREAMRAGDAAFGSRDLPGAVANYSRAWSLKQSYSIACKLGRAHAELVQHAEAATYLEYCLRHFTDTSQFELQELEPRFRALLAEERRYVGEVHLTLTPNDAAVAVNGNHELAAVLKDTVFLAPGAHRLEASRPGYLTRTVDLTIAAGERRDVALELDPAPPRPTASSVASSAPLPDAGPVPTPRGVPRLVWVLGSGALATGGFAVGLAYQLRAASRDDAAETLRREAVTAVGQGGCGAPDAPRVCATLARTVREANQSRDLATGGWVVGGVFAAVAVAAGAWPRQDPRTALVPTLDAQGVTVAVTHRF